MARPYITRTYWYYKTPDGCAAICAHYQRALLGLAAEGVTWEWWDVPALPGVFWLRPHLILVVHWRDRAQFERARLKKRIRGNGGSLIG